MPRSLCKIRVPASVRVRVRVRVRAGVRVEVGVRVGSYRSRWITRSPGGVFGNSLNGGRSAPSAIKLASN